MPRHFLHSCVQMILHGRYYPTLHRVLDLPSFFRLPKTLHESTVAFLIGYLLYDMDGGLAALLHVDLDAACNPIIIEENKIQEPGVPIIDL